MAKVGFTHPLQSLNPTLVRTVSPLSLSKTNRCVFIFPKFTVVVITYITPLPRPLP
jgi:hypothetical protein